MARLAKEMYIQSEELDMLETQTEIETTANKIDGLLSDLIPPRETWTPVDEALYKPTDLMRVPIDEAQALQFKAIKYAFTRQYTENTFYHRYCDNGASEREDAQGPGVRTARARRCRRHTRVQLGRKAEDGDHVTG